MIVTLIFINENGQELWSQTYGREMTGNTYDGGYIIGGSTDSYGNGGDDLYLLKTNENGKNNGLKHLVELIMIKDMM